MTAKSKFCCLSMKNLNFLKFAVVLFNLLIIVDLGLTGYKLHLHPSRVLEKDFIVQIINRLTFLIISIIAFFGLCRRNWKIIEYYGVLSLIVFTGFIVSLCINLIFLALGKSSLPTTENTIIPKKFIIIEASVYSGFIVLYCFLIWMSQELVIRANNLKAEDIRNVSKISDNSMDICNEKSTLNETTEIILKSS